MTQGEYMRPEKLRSARIAANLTQQQAANRLGVSQAYLAMIENGRRPVTSRLLLEIVSLYGLGPTALPLSVGAGETWNSASVAAALAALGYPGFRQLAGGQVVNPAVVLLAAVASDDLEMRVIEALPWLFLEYSNLDWEWLIRESKLRDVQNRLGFLIALARYRAEKRADRSVAVRLRRVEEVLERARLAREDTLCQASLSETERRWLRRARPAVARHWKLLTDLEPDSLRYVA
jgi:transcriptional regulator with XRE-family HTH domain